MGGLSFSAYKNYSRISRIQRLSCLAEAALRMVRIDCAVLPFFPMTLPKSVWATRSSMTAVFSPTISVMCTCSGLSTSAVTISLISSFMSIVPSHSRVSCACCVVYVVKVLECCCRYMSNVQCSRSATIVKYNKAALSPKVRHRKPANGMAKGKG